MFVSKDIKDRVEQQLTDKIAIAESRYGISIKQPTVTYTKRGTTAGTANYRTWVIDLNPILLNENVEEMIGDTVPHELAHLIDYQLYPENFDVRYGQKRSLHGPTWKSIMVALGCSPDRCHNMDTSRAKVRRKAQYTYVCDGCGNELTMGPVRHKKEQARPGTYTARCCGRRRGTLTLKSRVKSTPAKAANAPAPKPTNERRPWKEVAVEVFGRTSTRKEFIDTMMKLGCGKNTASTYHHNVKSGKWS